MGLNNPIAIIGMAGVFPGAANLAQFWNNIVDCVDATGEVPSDRWIIPHDAVLSTKPMPDKALSGRACLIEDFSFDPSGLDLDPGIVNSLDPLHHLVLHAGRDAFKRCNTASVDLNRVGTILAAIALPTDAASFLARATVGKIFESKILGDMFPPAAPLSPSAGLAAHVTSLPAALLAQGLGLGGGTYTLDAACASSLYAIKLACDELSSDRADMMLAGGVSRPDCLYTQIGFSQLQALSPTGRCAPFDSSANGLVVGEGVGIVALKRLSDALKDGDTIHGVIRGIGLANDIGGSLLAPDSEGQVRAMRAAYARAGWSPQDVDLIECHGAGTPMGDKTELQSLSTLWADERWHPGQCGIGSVKSMIGHLLTAAGAAGLIKTLLAIKHTTLPPSLKFDHPPARSPLVDGPWRVITEQEPWIQRSEGMPRRAAVSAFGFGGINAHLLVEEWLEDHNPSIQIGGLSSETLNSAVTESASRSETIAIIGMETTFGHLKGLRAFQEAIFNGVSNFASRPESRTALSDPAMADHFQSPILPGGYIENVEVFPGEYHIPPNEIPDIIPQHLLMLQVAAGAMADAGMPMRERQPRTGVIVGIDFDFEATNFILRWDLHNQVQKWRQYYELNDQEAAQWLDTLKQTIGPPLTATRTLGALGGVIASRIAKEFLLGGPSFVVSNADASGLKALDIAIRSIQQGETDTMVVGAVDFTGDCRRLIGSHLARPYSEQETIRPFDKTADGTLPGEGAVAIVLKRLDKALDNNDRIYSLVKGLGHAHQGDGQQGLPDKNAYIRALTQACTEAKTSPASIQLIETHGTGNPLEDDLEAESIAAVFADIPTQAHCLSALGSLKPIIGHTGAASGLASVAKASLCLFHEIVPALPNFQETASNRLNQDVLHLPKYPHYWFRDRSQGPRLACVNALTTDGNCASAILEAYTYASLPETPAEVLQNRRKPLGLDSYGLFAVHGETKTDLLAGLDKLSNYLQKKAKQGQALEQIACQWHRRQPLSANSKLALAVTLKDINAYSRTISGARKALSIEKARNSEVIPNVSFTATPLGPQAEVAFVFPGSGNHYVGMGRQIGLALPEIMRQFDAEHPNLASQHRPRWLIPQRVNWLPGWDSEATAQIASDPLHMIFGQVVHGGLMTRVVQSYGIKPSAVIGYSLGESAGLFAMGAWPDRDAMLKRMIRSDLFTEQLSGPCRSARKSWGIPLGHPFEWSVAVVNQSADEVRQVLAKWPHVRLLIVNTPHECVIGGDRQQVTAAIEKMGCNAFFLDGVVTVHCDAARPVRADYKKLHVFPVFPPEDVRFYSCAKADAYTLTSDAAAESITQQALKGFDFPATIEKAHADGVRIFLEMGPQASCTRMIATILADKPHMAVSACRKTEDDQYTILKLLGKLIAQRIPINLDALYGAEAFPPELNATLTADMQGKPKTPTPSNKIVVPVGGLNWPEALPTVERYRPTAADREPEGPITSDASGLQEPMETLQSAPSDPAISAGYKPEADVTEAIDALNKASDATAAAHQKFLDFSGNLTRTMSDAFELQTRILQAHLQSAPHAAPASEYRPPADKLHPTLAFNRDLCMEFAIGSVEKVLGPEYAIIDSYKTRVRLPDEPLMLVDRILSIDGQKQSLGPGKIVTEHDVLPDAWYLDGGRAPVCISVEAGQADLFLCAYLGIDHVVKGERTYRLLDATVEFLRDLPAPGDVLRYEIEIEKFVKQGATHLFFFNFRGFVNNTPLLRMTNGCAGFFTEDEVRNSGGIILTAEDLESQPGTRPDDWKELAPIETATYSDQAIEALRQGDLERCFGQSFENVPISPELCLPGDRMHLIDRVQVLDPTGGKYGLGIIRAEADIHPDDWFLTCHFMDDMVMPGTLMYECCAHTLRIFVQRLGWVASKPDVHYGPVPGVKSILKCRGPVTPETKQVIYEVEIKEMGYRPEPYVIADAHMYADGHRIVMFQDMSLQMWGIRRDEIEALWHPRPSRAEKHLQPAFDKQRLREFCRGKPSIAFGEPYAIFDKNRFIARLPAPPYAFIDRIVSADPPAWVLAPDGWIAAEFDVRPEDWYFKANRTASMPYCVLNEIALQACGWLAAYMGSALHSKKDLRFRNLGGTAVIKSDIHPDKATLKTRARLTQVSEAGEMIIEHFDFCVILGENVVYEGNTHFGFFTEQALAQQVGVRENVPNKSEFSQSKPGLKENYPLQQIRPLTPDDQARIPFMSAAMPSSALCMFDKIETYLPDGGLNGCGYVRGHKTVDPGAWFFKAHFYQDPVCPGSLGLESLLQLLKFDALQRWDSLVPDMRFAPLMDVSHEWIYRGQILPTNREITVDALITEVGDANTPFLKADGYLHVDGLCIYKMQNFGIKLVPLDDSE